MQEEQARTEFMQTGAEQAGGGCMPVQAPQQCPNAFPDIDLKCIPEGTPPELRAFLEGGGISLLKGIFERTTADKNAEGARKHEETLAKIRANNMANEAIAIAATAAAAEAEANEAAGDTEQEGSDIEDDELMDTLLSPENLALLASSDVDGRRAVWKRVVKAKTMQKKLSGKRG